MNDEYNLNKLIMRGRHLTDKTSGSDWFLQIRVSSASLLLFYRRQLHVKRKSNILEKIK